MKKLNLNKLFITTLIFMLFIISPSAKAEIRYDVEEMLLSDTQVTFKGWAIIAGYNNYGGYLSEILITATDGTNEIVKSNYSGTNATDALKKYKLNGSTENNFYKVMCYNRTEEANNCYEEASTSCSNNGDCTYRNINFNISFTYEELKNMAMIGNDIRFKLTVRAINDNMTTLNGNLTKNFATYRSLSTGTNVTSETINLGVYKNNCKITTTNEVCASDKQVGDLLLSNITSGTNFTITHKSTYVQAGNTNTPAEVTTLTRYLNGTEDYHWNTTDPVSKTIKAKTGNRIQYAGSGAYQYAYSLTTLPSGIPTSLTHGYAYASWGGVSNELRIKFENAKSCEPANYNETLKINCNGTCENNEGNCASNSQQHRDFTPIPYADEPCEHYFSATGTSGSETVTASTTVKFEQRGDITFNMPEGNQTIISGTSFHFSIVYNVKLITDYNEANITCSGSTEACNNAKQNLKNEIMGWYTQLTADNLTNNSNIVIDGLNATTKLAGKWYVDYDNNNGDTTGSASAFLSSGEMKVTATYNIGAATIDPSTGKVTYSEYDGSINVPCLNDGTYAGTCRYFTEINANCNNPINVTAKISGLSLLNGTNWKVEYTCSVKCRNEYIGNRVGGDTNFMFYYRPISTSNPFPLGTYAENWESWINSVGGESDALTIIEKSYEENNLEYKVKIDRNKVTQIRNYNDSNNYLKSEINEDGQSTYINNNNFFTRTANNYFSILGKCTNDAKDENNCYCPTKNADGSCAHIGG